MKKPMPKVYVRNTRPEDFSRIVEMSRTMYPEATPWKEEQLQSHIDIFPEGQFVAVEEDSGRVVGMASSLIILWDDYETEANWRNFTDTGYFRNHDPQNGRTLYGADVMVDPDMQGRGVGKLIYQARTQLTEKMGLLRIRAGARLRGYRHYAEQMSAEDYTIKVIRKELGDPTLSFQLKRGFQVIAVVSNYIRNDFESLGYAAVIEWINEAVARPEDSTGWPLRFRPPKS